MSEQLGRVAYEAHGGGEPWHKLRPHTKRSWMKAARDVLAAARGGAQPVELNSAQLAAAVFTMLAA